MIEQSMGSGMNSASLDDVKKAVDQELSKPVPGRKDRPVSQTVIDDEMAMFHAASAQNRR